MRTLKFSKGCKIEMVKTKEGLLIKRKGRKCPKKEDFAQELIESIKENRIRIK